MDRKRRAEEKQRCRVKRHREIKDYMPQFKVKPNTSSDDESSENLEENSCSENMRCLGGFEDIADGNQSFQGCSAESRSNLNDSIPTKSGASSYSVVPLNSRKTSNFADGNQNLPDCSADNTSSVNNSNSTKSDVTSQHDPSSDPSDPSDSDDTSASNDVSSSDEFSDVDEYDGIEIHYNNGRPEIQLLREWIIKRKIHLSYADELLAILRTDLLPDLPKCAKTFIGTTGARYNIEPMMDKKGSMGEFVYFGVQKGLVKCVNVDLHPSNRIEVQINVDGVPLVKSGNQSFCPILCKVHCQSDIYEPFAVAIYFGESKPQDVNKYFEKFVNEVNDLQRDGIQIDGKHFVFVIKCFVCDTPMRSYLKCIVGHKSFNSCERCTVTGESIERRTTFSSTDSAERTDASFRAGSQASHHTGLTPLLRIMPFLNIVMIFVLDFMHLCCQGIMKKMLEYWVDHGVNKLNVSDRNELSRRTERLKNQVPCEFQRKPRSTTTVGKWKATEFRFFLLYSGPVVLIGLLTSKLYKHFLLLHVACRILCSARFCQKFKDRAKIYLRIFFKYLKDYYGATSQTMNSHNLIHLADDVQHMQCSLSLITAFPFESLLGKIKKSLRTPFRPLAQLCRRIHEETFVKNKRPMPPQLVEIMEEDVDNNILKLRYKECIITTVSPNNTLLLKDKTVIIVEKMRIRNDNIQIEGKVWEKKGPIFEFPVNSTSFDMWEIQTKPSNRSLTFEITSIDSKLVKLSINRKTEAVDKVYVIPLLHQ